MSLTAHLGGPSLFAQKLRWFSQLRAKGWGSRRTRDQSFTYDALNRLTSAQNAGTNCAATTVNGKTEYWGNSYGYDAWGNLTNKTITKCGAELLNAPALVNNQLSGYGYDSAGNMTSDPTDHVTASYDAENRISSAATASGTFTYTYDADGNRVEKSGGGSGTLYWYMTPGVVAESDLAGNLKSEYVFFNGERVARRDYGSPGGVFYYFSDHLKTASVITDSVGNIKAESDYYPWGGELQFVNNDSNHSKFTGKERDAESGLDYFGARYYSNGLGRFITPDWAAKATAVPYAEFADPQSLNLYSYVRNIPTSRTDPSGHKVEYLPDKKNAEEANKRVLGNVSKAEKKLFHTTTDKETGRHELKLDAKAAAKFQGEHTEGYNKLVAAINSDKTAVVSVQATVGATGDDGQFHVYNVAKDFGGGTTTQTGNGNVLVVLAPDGNKSAPEQWATQGPNGTKLPDPVNIIAGHELLGHGVDYLTTGVTSEDHAISVEKQLRDEQHVAPRVP